MKIDKNLTITPARVISKSKIVYSDHYAIILKFTDLPLKSEQFFPGQKYTRWNTNKEGGWVKYKHPVTKKCVTDSKEIKKISLKYCVDLLTN